MIGKLIEPYIMSVMFDECNRIYFSSSLPRPRFGVSNNLRYYACFQCRNNCSFPEILFLAHHRFTNIEFKDIMLHEMIHYYMAYNNIKDNEMHGDKFRSISIEKYGKIV